MEDVFADIEKLLNKFSFDTEKDLGPKYSVPVGKDEDDKKTRKKLKKYQIESEENNEKALEKVNKLLDELYKNYEIAGKTFGKVKSLKNTVDASEIERNRALDQKKMIEGLQSNFKKKYEEEIQKAQQIQKDEEIKRKKVIEELQERIKVIQTRYEEAGKIKIQKYKDNQTLKHELSKYEPHLVAAESLSDAQIKKKGIEIEIQMTTLKQKIQMMDNFKNMRAETEIKLKNSLEVEEKLEKRTKKLEGKEEEHKMTLAKAHLVFEDYKKALNVLKEVLPKKEREAMLSKQKVQKAEQSLMELRKKLEDLDKDYDVHTKQLEVLLTLEKNLRKELEE